MPNHKFSQRRSLINRRNSGSAFVEALGAAVVLIPIALIVLDLMVMVITNSFNDSAAKNAARAAANQKEFASAFNAADKSLKAFKPNAIMPELKMVDMTYNDKDGTVKVLTQMKVNLPVPFPGYQQLTFRAQALEPIVGDKRGSY